MKQLSFFCIMLLSFLSSQAQEKVDQTNAKPMPVFIMAGQSNMVGVSAKTNIENLPPELQKSFPQVLFTEFWGKKFNPLVPKNDIGPEFGFGKEFSASMGQTIGIIKLASGGTSLKQHWNPDPLLYNKEKSIGELFKRLTAYVVEIKKENPNIKIMGMCWMQGEADSRYGKVSEEEYRKMLEMFVEGCRKEMDEPEMAFVCGRVVPPKDWPNRDNVRKAQETVTSKNYAWVDCDSFELGKDNLHFTAKGQLALGASMAKAMEGLLKKKESK